MLCIIGFLSVCQAKQCLQSKQLTDMIPQGHKQIVHSITGCHFGSREKNTSFYPHLTHGLRCDGILCRERYWLRLKLLTGVKHSSGAQPKFSTRGTKISIHHMLFCENLPDNTAFPHTPLIFYLTKWFLAASATEHTNLMAYRDLHLCSRERSSLS